MVIIKPHPRCPTGSFWWKDILKLFEKFKSFSVVCPIKAIQLYYGLKIGLVTP